MKKNKEYPATHSMDTAWFTCDLDGNDSRGLPLYNTRFYLI